MPSFDDMLNPVKETATTVSQKSNETVDKITTKAQAIPNIPVIQDLKIGRGTIIGIIILASILIFMGLLMK